MSQAVKGTYITGEPSSRGAYSDADAGGVTRRRGCCGGSFAATASAAESAAKAGMLEVSESAACDAPRRTGNTLTATAHILTAVIGAGVLSLPVAVAMLGWIAGPLCILLFGGLTQVCSVLLADCYIIDGKINRTYSEVVAACFGRSAVIAIGIVQHANLVLVTLAYAITAPQSLQTIANSVCRQNATASCFNSYNWWAIIFGASQLLMCQLPSVDSLWLASIFGAIMSFGYSGIAIGMSAAEAGGDPQGTLGGASFSSPADKAFQVLNSIGAILFAYNFRYLVEIQDTIKTGRPPGPVRSMCRAITTSVAIMTCLYLAVACSGYAAFGNSVPGSIMTAFTSPAWLVNLANAMVVAHLGPAYQICIQPTLMFLEARIEAWPRNPRWNRGLALRLWFRSLVVVVITFLAILMPFFGSIVGLSGALSFWPVTVEAPVSCYIKARQPPSSTRLCLRALSCATLLISLAACVGAVQQVVDGWHTAGAVATPGLGGWGSWGRRPGGDGGASGGGDESAGAPQQQPQRRQQQAEQRAADERLQPDVAAGPSGDGRPRAANSKKRMSSSIFTPFPDLPPDGHTLTPKEERCDPETEVCRTPIHVWESRCGTCDGTGTARQWGSSRARGHGRGRGGSAHRMEATCLLCHGLGYVRHSAARDVPHMGAAHTGPPTTLARPPPAEYKHTVIKRFVSWPSAYGGGPKKKAEQ